MKKIFLLILIYISLFALDVRSQTAPETPVTQTSRIKDWNTLRRSGFYDCVAAETPNAPNNSFGWFWGLNIGHSANIRGDVSAGPYYYNGQILMGLNQSATGLPSMYIRSTNQNGEGLWAKVLHDQGLQTIKGDVVLLSDQITTDWGASTTVYNSYGKKIYLGGVQDNYDPLWIARYNTGRDASELHVNLGDGIDDKDKFIIGTTDGTSKAWISQFIVTSRGNVGIGGVTNPTNKLEVNGVIRAKEVKIEATNWPDYVFNKEYNLPTLKEVEEHINEYNHLPNIPSEAEVKEKGVDLGDMQIKLLQKIEELTLYMIEQEKSIQEQNKRMQEQDKTILNLQQQLNKISSDSH